MHKLLQRQMRRYLGTPDAQDAAPAEWQRFLEAVNEAYEQADVDRAMLERSLELSSQMLLDKNRQLQFAKDAAEAASRAKSSFLANMSHELRTPLTVVIGYAEMLQEDGEQLGYREILGALKKIQSSARHLLTLINEILDLSKIEAGKMELRPETVDVQALIDSVATAVQPLMAHNANQLIVEMLPGLGTFVADAMRVRQVLFNLLGNAAKFTEHGTVTLVVERQPVDGEDWLIFRVRDTGIGMTPEQREAVFEEFVQADASTTRRYGGTGLGLAIARHFCQIMDGEISVESELGHGSTFTVVLPAESHPPHAAAPRGGRAQRPVPAPAAPAAPATPNTPGAAAASGPAGAAGGPPWRIYAEGESQNA